MQLTALENDVIEILSQDSRLSAEKIATMTGAEKGEVQAVIDALEQARVIVGYPALINWDKTEKQAVEAVIEVRVSPVKGFGFDALAEEIMAFEQVESVYLMSGAYDLHIRLKASDIKELARFVSETLAPMENVLSTATHFVLKKYKSQGIIMEKNVDHRQAVSG